jgi:hypothetical protein
MKLKEIAKELKLFLVHFFLNIAFNIAPDGEFKKKYCEFLINNINKL